MMPSVGEMSARISFHFWVHAVCLCVVLTVGIQGVCFHKFTTPSGQISSPTHPKNYSSSTECRYLIHVPEDFIVVLRFTHFDLEPEYRLACRFDFLQVFDGAQFNSTSLGKFCGAELPNPVQSSSNVLSIKFVTDNSDHYAGFRVNYTTKKVRYSYRFTNLTGHFQSLNYPNGYPSFLRCSYLIQVPTGYKIILTFLDFDLKPGYRNICQFEYVEVVDGAQSNSTSLGRFCDKSTAPASVHSTGNNLLVRFVTGDVSENHKGFRVSYVSKKEDCMYTFTKLSGQFESPNFPESYPSSIECFYYLIQVPFGYNINLVFSHFDLEAPYRGECRFDFIQVFDGPNTRSPSLGRFCGAALPTPVNSTNNVLLVMFATDDSEQHTGFRVNYTTNKVCNFKYTELAGSFWAYYVNQYRHMKECNYLIQVPAGYTITLHFRYIHLPAPYKECEAHSYVQVFAGSQSSSPLLGRFCGSIVPAPIYSTTNSLLVKFVRPRFSSNRDGPYFFAQYSTRKTNPETQCGNVSTLTSSQECFTKILGGRDAGRRDFPWQVLIEGKGFICGGSLVYKDWVMTAAHCVRDQNKPLSRRSFKVHLGLHRQNRKDNRHVQTKSVDRIVAHENFDYRTLNNDLALVKLSTGAVINNYVNLLCLPSKDRHSRMMTSQETHGMVAGWGLNARLKETTVLKKVCLPVVSNKTCQEKTSFPIQENTFCAGTGSKDSCRGDSGGAFAVYDRTNRRWFAGGIVSWGTSSACIRRNYGIYVRVDRYVDWIKKVVSSL